MKRNNVFTIVNSLPLKQIQSNQKESLIEVRKSDKELQYVKPQIRDHSNKVLASKFFNISMGLSMSSKVRTLRSFQTNHLRHAGTICINTITFHLEANIPNFDINQPAVFIGYLWRWHVL